MTKIDSSLKGWLVLVVTLVVGGFVVVEKAAASHAHSIRFASSGADAESAIATTALAANGF
jgi:hypothetical protein